MAQLREKVRPNRFGGQMDFLDAGDCGLLFDAAPSPCLILKPDADFTILAASRRYLQLTGTRRQDLVGHGLFELFPGTLDHASSCGIGELRQSLQRVLRDQIEDVMSVYEYQIDRGMALDGTPNIEFRYWRLTNTPANGPDGTLRFIVHHAEDVTATLQTEDQLHRRHQEEERRMVAYTKRLRAEIEQLREMSERANSQLQATIEVLEHRDADIARLRGRHDNLSQLHSALDRLSQSVFDSICEGAFILDASLRIAAVNRAFTEITGYSPPEMVGQMPLFLRASRTPPGTYASIWDALNASGHWEGELWNRRKSGELFLQRLIINTIDGGGIEPSRYVGVFTDITELRRKDEHLQHLAFYDALTDLPNRLLLQDRLQHALERAGRERRRLAVLFVDLDRFKAVNDNFGHEIGDVLLQNVARRLKGSVRSMDTVARLGGDEFIIVLEEVEDARDCARVAATIVNVMDQPVELDGRSVVVGASVGIALYPDDASSASDLIRRADAAMYLAKARGGGRAHFAGDTRNAATAAAARDEVRLDDDRR